MRPETGRLRGKDMATVFPGPMTALKPGRSVGGQMAEVMRIHGAINGQPACASRPDPMRGLDADQARASAAADGTLPSVLQGAAHLLGRILRATIGAFEGMRMHTGANTGRRWTALVAAFLFVFQALIASAALPGPGAAPGATTIICTASGPRVVTLDAEGGVAQDAQQHSGALPHCCFAGCAMLGAAALLGLPPLAWRLPPMRQALPAPTVDIHFSSAQARLPRQSRAPPVLA